MATSGTAAPRPGPTVSGGWTVQAGRTVADQDPAAEVERKILSLRRNKKLGPTRIAGRLELAPSTVHAVLARHQITRLAWMDRRPCAATHRRPGDLVHVVRAVLTDNGSCYRSHHRL